MKNISKLVAEALGLEHLPSTMDYVVILTILIVGVLTLRSVFADGEGNRSIIPDRQEDEDEVKAVVVDEQLLDIPGEKSVIKEKIGESWDRRLFKGLSKTRSEVWGKIGSLLGTGNELSEEVVEQIEEILFTSDLSPTLVAELLEELRSTLEANKSTEDYLLFIKEFLKSKMSAPQEKVNQELYKFSGSKDGPKVIMIVGVNGAGKTTTIGKLATKLKSQGAKVVVGACDTFRAAAVEQLEVWCNRAEVQIVKAGEGADPSGVAYDAVAKAKELNADYCIIDTAGRLHTKSNLMDELVKTKKVMSKVISDAPHETLLVVDAITGQNALRQAEEFNKSLELSGLIFTKCDGSSKAGSAVSIVQTLSVPIVYIGVGEDVEDLDIFSLDPFLDALLGLKA